MRDQLTHTQILSSANSLYNVHTNGFAFHLSHARIVEFKKETPVYDNGILNHVFYNIRIKSQLTLIFQSNKLSIVRLHQVHSLIQLNYECNCDS